MSLLNLSMNVILDISQFDKDCVHFQKPVRNTVMDNSNFIRVVYSNELFSLNGLFVKFSLRNARTERYFAKFKCSFGRNDNEEVVRQLINLEGEILRRAGITGKQYACKIREQLQAGTIKLFANEPDGQIGNNFLLKVSGVWETADELGVTFKFIDSHHA
tara:strand:- start:3477 stop:3956 length:480 start_codon:yes stop_codon:yes gene_type:complete